MSVKTLEPRFNYLKFKSACTFFLKSTHMTGTISENFDSDFKNSHQK